MNCFAWGKLRSRWGERERLEKAPNIWCCDPGFIPKTRVRSINMNVQKAVFQLAIFQIQDQ